jgi:dTDP-4-dehydrorhamnose 3,5-epimerase
MKTAETSLKDVLIIEPDVFNDPRGFFMETFHQEKYRELGIKATFVQDNLSSSVRGTLRGLHYQHPHDQAKLVQILAGRVFDVVVDIRRGSPTFGRWTGMELDAQSPRQLYVPEGFAHGFCVLSERAIVAYKCTDFYAPNDEGGMIWSDPDAGIDWPIGEPLLSEKDSRYPLLKDIPPDRLPSYGS